MTRPIVSRVSGRTAPPGEGEELGMCCFGAAVYGAYRCTCWEPVYDLEQQPLANGGELPDGYMPPTRTKCCHDCAYRNGSPERLREEDDELQDIASDPGKEFWCHQGSRRIVAYRHPDGREIVEENPGAYDPPVGPENRPVAWKADGSVGERCAGWASRRIRSGSVID